MYVRVVIRSGGGRKVVDPSLYDVTWVDATAKGKATVVIRGKGTATDKGMAVGSKKMGISITAMALGNKSPRIYVEKLADAVGSLKDLFFNRQ